MSIDQQLRAALSQEAEMQTVPPPDVDRLIIGGKVRQRRRNLARVAWVGVAVAVAVLVVGGVYGVVRTGSGDAVGPATQAPTPTAHPYLGSGGVRAGTYVMEVGVDDTGATINADVTFYSDAWQVDDYPVLSGAKSHGGVGVYQPSGLASGTGCLDGPVNTSVGTTPESLALQLAQLPRSTLVQPPTPMQGFGHDAVHLRLRIKNYCNDGIYRVAESPGGGRGISYSETPKQVVIDFWVIDMGGPVPVVVDAWHEDDASSGLVDQITRTRDSITFETDG